MHRKALLDSACREARARRRAGTCTRLTWCSRFDEPHDMGGHAAGSHRSDPHLGAGERRFEHLTLSQIDGDVLAAAGTPEDEVTATHLRHGDTTPLIILSP